MDNATHQPIVSLDTANSSAVVNHTQQQANNNKSANEPEQFLTIRLLMQGKVGAIVLCRMMIYDFLLDHIQEVGSIIGKRGDNIKAIREEVCNQISTKENDN